eukprot:4032863-Prymnesium_polylepis.1
MMLELRSGLQAPRRTRKTPAPSPAGDEKPLQNGDPPMRKPNDWDQAHPARSGAVCDTRRRCSSSRRYRDKRSVTQTTRKDGDAKANTADVRETLANAISRHEPRVRPAGCACSRLRLKPAGSGSEVAPWVFCTWRTWRTP